MVCLKIFALDAVQRVDAEAVVADKVLGARGAEALRPAHVLVADVVDERRALVDVAGVAVARVGVLFVDGVATVSLGHSRRGLATRCFAPDLEIHGLLAALCLHHVLAHVALLLACGDRVLGGQELARAEPERGRGK